MRLFLFILVLAHSNAFASPAGKPFTPENELSSAVKIQVEDTTTHQSLESGTNSEVRTLKPSSKKENVTSEGFSASDIIAIVAALLSGCSMLYTYRIDSSNRKASIHDEYWMREVIYPTFMQSFIEFIKDSPKEFRESEGDMSLFVNAYALDELNKIRDNTAFLNAIDESLPEKAEEIIDGLEDILGDVSDVSEFKEALAKVSKEIVTLLKSAQEKV